MQRSTTAQPLAENTQPGSHTAPRCGQPRVVFRAQTPESTNTIPVRYLPAQALSLALSPSISLSLSGVPRERHATQDYCAHCYCTYRSIIIIDRDAGCNFGHQISGAASTTLQRANHPPRRREKNSTARHARLPYRTLTTPSTSYRRKGLAVNIQQ